ncbi:DUF4429 domain-containing protein [Streptomyces sp. 8L]|uniref:DUF4429 domain-containing protein n=1 Tax=Streptomyces sp. 8L TaxID=2877242 RepID=UPI001CD5BD3F|nr:DUF4429 domain-containing protein [Streptomyces sp. 8L]MCA1220507.1 DUF4429 domain-containing protein [Streptomyces sp. 8L]
MGDVLAGIHATWEFEGDSVLIRFGRGIRTPRLFQVLRERRVPYEALASVAVSPGRRGAVVLRARVRPGADPLMDAADGQLKEACDPYRLVLPAGRETLAEYYAQELRSVLDASASDPECGDWPAPRPAEAHLVASPAAPLAFKAYDGRAAFDGSQVSFRWSWTGASTTKWKAGDQTFRVEELQGVEWRSPEGPDGCLRLVRRAPAAAGPAAARGAAPGRSCDEAERRAQPDHDPAAVVFGVGYGPVHESLPFAAAVLAAVRGGGAARAQAPAPAVAAGGASEPARSVADRIRQLGELHRAGLVTDEEFTSKKAQLLAEL